MEDCRHHLVRLHAEYWSRTHFLACSDGGRNASRCGTPTLLAWRLICTAARPLGRPRHSGAYPICPAVDTDACADLVQHISPRPHFSCPTTAVCVWWRSSTHRLCPSHCGRRIACTYRIARPAATRSRDDARAGAIGQCRAVPLCTFGKSVCAAAIQTRRHLRFTSPGGERRAKYCNGARRRRGVGLSAIRLLAGSPLCVVDRRKLFDRGTRHNIAKRLDLAGGAAEPIS